MCLQVAEPLLPYALSFAAGAMVYVVLNDLVPEANQWSVCLFLSLLLCVPVNSGSVSFPPAFNFGQLNVHFRQNCSHHNATDNFPLALLANNVL